MAGNTLTKPCGYRLRPRFHTAVIPNRNSDLTPRITRRPEPMQEFNSRRVGGRAHALVRLRDIFSPSPATRLVKGQTRPASCLSLPAPTVVRPSMMAGDLSIMRLRHPPRPRFHSAVIPNRNSNLTPGITRPPARLG